MDLSVILCTHNRAESLRATLDSLGRMRVPEELEWELLVVDNNSSDHTRQIVETADPGLPCRYLFEGRRGKSFALNTAIPESRGEVVAFTDDDVTVHEDWISALWSAFQEGDHEGVGGRILPVWDREKPRWFVETGPYRIMEGVIVTYDHGSEAHETEQLPFGANMAFRRDVFEVCGPFKTDLGPSGRTLMRGEDTEFGGRVLDGGGRILYAPDAIVYHPVEPGRAQERYCLRWYRDFGRRDVRVGDGQPGAVRWFGVPRHVFRGLGLAAIKWLLSTDPQRRFYFKLQSYRLAGQFMEFRRRARQGESPSSGDGGRPA